MVCPSAFELSVWPVPGVWSVLSAVMVCVLLRPLVSDLAHSVIVVAREPGVAGAFLAG